MGRQADAGRVVHGHRAVLRRCASRRKKARAVAGRFLVLRKYWLLLNCWKPQGHWGRNSESKRGTRIWDPATKSSIHAVLNVRHALCIFLIGAGFGSQIAELKTVRVYSRVLAHVAQPCRHGTPLPREELDACIFALDAEFMDSLDDNPKPQADVGSAWGGVVAAVNGG